MKLFEMKRVWFAAFISVFITAGAGAVPFNADPTMVRNSYSNVSNSSNSSNSGYSNISSSGLMSGAGSAPTTVADLGALSGDSGPITGSLLVNEILWYSFMADGFTYLDINTNGTAFDTEIGLYDDAGNRIANDDDDGFGLRSTLSFGAGSGMTLGGSFDLGGDGIANGEDGPLAAGLYYLALGEFQTDFNDTGFDVISTGPDVGGDYTIEIFTDAMAATPIPEPAALLLLGLGLVGIGFARRRL